MDLLGGRANPGRRAHSVSQSLGHGACVRACAAVNQRRTALNSHRCFTAAHLKMLKYWQSRAATGMTAEEWSRVVLTCLPTEMVQLHSQTQIWAAHRSDRQNSRIVRAAASYLLHKQRKSFMPESSDSRGALPPKTRHGVPYFEVACSAIGVAFLIFASAFIFSFCLHQSTDADKKKNHAAAMDLALCLAVDLLFTFPLFIFVITVVLPHLAARIVDASRLEHEVRHAARSSFDKGGVPVVIAQRLVKALDRARTRLTVDQQGDSELALASTPNNGETELGGYDPETFNPITSTTCNTQSTPTTPSAGPWVPVEDPASGGIYYYNADTGESQWEPPEQMAAGHADDASQDIDIGSLFPSSNSSSAEAHGAHEFSVSPLRTKTSATAPDASSG